MSNHKIPVVRIEEILPHPNADRLELIIVGGFQVVAGKGQFKIGDLAYYVPPDSVLPERSVYSFVWEKDGGGNPRQLIQGDPVPEKWRRVTVRRLRKEWSEGLLMPTIEPYRDSLNGIDFYKPADFALLRDNGNEGNQIQVQEGDDVAEFLGITHWNPPEDQEDREPKKQQTIAHSPEVPEGLVFLSAELGASNSFPRFLQPMEQLWWCERKGSEEHSADL